MRRNARKNHGLYKKARQKRMYFAPFASLALLGTCKVVARALHSKKSAAFGALEQVNTLQNQIQNFMTSNQVQKCFKLANWQFCRVERWQT